MMTWPLENRQSEYKVWSLLLSLESCFRYRLGFRNAFTWLPEAGGKAARQAKACWASHNFIFCDDDDGVCVCVCVFVCLCVCVCVFVCVCVRDALNTSSKSSCALSASDVWIRRTLGLNPPLKKPCGEFFPRQSVRQTDRQKRLWLTADDNLACCSIYTVSVARDSRTCAA